MKKVVAIILILLILFALFAIFKTLSKRGEGPKESVSHVIHKGESYLYLFKDEAETFLLDRRELLEKEAEKEKELLKEGAGKLGKSVWERVTNFLFPEDRNVN